MNKCSQTSDFNTKKRGAPAMARPDTPPGNLTHTDNSSDEKTLGEFSVMYTYRIQV